jgi:hypothetical protein
MKHVYALAELYLRHGDEPSQAAAVRPLRGSALPRAAPLQTLRNRPALTTGGLRASQSFMRRSLP